MQLLYQRMYFYYGALSGLGIGFINAGDTKDTLSPALLKRSSLG